mmetsp:Transcript_13335/g.26099  ORF Transcript_13335/g.26099 Transcript_13335/m.26099 type:complete len:241 (-) Transcript_13335:948-1670(-)
MRARAAADATPRTARGAGIFKAGVAYEQSLVSWLACAQVADVIQTDHLVLIRAEARHVREIAVLVTQMALLALGLSRGVKDAWAFRTAAIGNLFLFFGSSFFFITGVHREQGLHARLDGLVPEPRFFFENQLKLMHHCAAFIMAVVFAWTTLARVCIPHQKPFVGEHRCAFHLSVTLDTQAPVREPFIISQVDGFGHVASRVEPAVVPTRERYYEISLPLHRTAHRHVVGDESGRVEHGD